MPDRNAPPGLDLYRCALGFVTEVADLDAAGLQAAIACEPAEIGDRHLDAMLGALAEHVAFHRDIDVPGWSEALAARLERRGVRASADVVDGAAMAMVFDERRSHR